MNQFQVGAPPISKINKIILLSSVVIFLLASILKAIGAFNLVGVLGLSASGLTNGFIFQLLSYPLVEVNLMSLVFNALIIWFIGTELEMQWGERVYLRFLLMNVMAVGLIYSLVNTIFFYGTYIYSAPIYGLSGINFAMLIAYALLYPDRQLSLMMIFPMRARTFCWILVGIEAYMALFSNLAASWAHLLAMGTSFLIIHFQTRPWMRKALNASFTTKKRPKNHLYVVKKEDEKPPKFWQ